MIRVEIDGNVCREIAITGDIQTTVMESLGILSAIHRTLARQDKQLATAFAFSIKASLGREALMDAVFLKDPEKVWADDKEK